MEIKKKIKVKSTTISGIGAARTLTPKQEHAVQEYLQWGNKTKAYATAYETDQVGQNLCVVAWKEFEKPHVKRRVKELQEKAVFEHLITKNTIAEEFDQARDLAISIDAPGAAVSASVAKAKLYGLLTDKVQQEITGPQGQPLITGPIQIEVLHTEKK